MARKKTAKELADDIRALEARLAKAREKQRQQSKAEEAMTNASIIRVVREWWDALPEGERPRWEQMPEYLRQMFTRMESVTEAPRQSL